MAYDNPAGMIAAAVILEIVTIVCIALRFYTRWWKKSQVFTSDWLILAAFICGTGLTVMQIYGVAVKALAYPLNGTIEDPRAVTGRLNKAKHIELAFLLLGIFALGLIKLSVTFLYWQIFAQVRFRRFLIVWILILIGWTISFIVAGLLECGSHLKALFGTPDQYLHSCGSAIPTGWAFVGSDVATDFITLIIPMPIISSLQLPTGRKILVMATFMVGALSVGASIAKAYIYIAASLGRYTGDAILLLTGISIWNLVEVQIGIIAACGPTLRPILTRILPTDSIRSLLSSIRAHKETRGSAEDLPSFVKMGSNVNVAGKKSDSTRTLTQGDSVELVFRTEASQKSQV